MLTVYVVLMCTLLCEFPLVYLMFCQKMATKRLISVCAVVKHVAILHDLHLYVQSPGSFSDFCIFGIQGCSLSWKESVPVHFEFCC